MASVDELIMRPTWTEIFKRKLQFSGFSASGVNIIATSDSSGSWDVIDLFRTTRPDSASAPFEFSIADLELSDVTLETRSTGSPTESILNNRIFDYTNALYRLDGLHVSIDLNSTSNIVDLYRLSGSVVGRDISFDNLQGQAVIESRQISINNIFLQSGDMTASAAGFVTWPNVDTGDQSTESVVGLDVALAQIENDKLAAIFPGWKFKDRFTASASLSGPISQLAITDANIESGNSKLEFSGAVTGLPDSVSIKGDLRIPSLTAKDLDLVAPHLSVYERTSVDSLTLSTSVLATFHRNGSRASQISLNNLVMNSSAGFVAGTASLKSSLVSELEAWGAVTLTEFNPATVINDPGLDGNVNGHVEFRSTNLSRTALQLDIVADLSRSTIGPVSADSSVVNGFIDGGLISGDVRVKHGGGTLVAGMSVDYSLAVPRYELEASATDLNAASMYSGFDKLTNLTGRISLYGSGITADEIAATLTVASDSSALTRTGGGVRYLNTTGTTVSIRRDAEGTTLVVDGDLIRGQIQANASLSSVKAARDHWQPVFVNRARELVTSRNNPEKSGDRNNVHLVDSTLNDIRVYGDFYLTDGEFLEAVLGTDIFAREVAVNFDINANAEKLAATSRATADSLDVYPFQTDSLSLSFDMTASIVDDSTDVVNFASSITGRNGSLLRQKLATPELAIVMSNRVGSFTFKSTNENSVSPVDISARIANTSDGTEFVFDRLSIESPTYSLALKDERRVQFYRDAIVVNHLQLEREDTGRTAEEYVLLNGILSNVPGDTLALESSNLSLDDLSQVFSFRKAIGGRLDSDIKLAAGDAIPVAIGNINIRNVAIDQRLLGDFVARSTYESRSNVIGISASIKPAAATPDVGMIRANNDIDITGTIEPRNASGERELDLRATVSRVDLFFFEYIFSSTIDRVSGFASGTGRVSGTFSKPVFDADFDIENGDFLVPRFNLHYGIQGSVTVDDGGIHIEDALIDDGAEGTASIQGSVLFNDYNFFSLDLQGTLAALEIMNVSDSDELPFYGHIRASGDARLTGPISGALLQTDNAVTTPESELYIPLVEVTAVSDASFIVFTDSTGVVPDMAQRSRRRNILARRPAGERSFLDGLDMDMNIRGPEGSTVHLVIDPLVGDVISAVGNARVQILRRGGEFYTYGTFIATGGDYLFTAGEVFVRKFDIDQGGLITWDGDPTNAQLNIPASYRTRASRAGLPSANDGANQSLIPLVVRLNITGRVAAPEVNLSLEIDRSDRNISTSYESIETILNQPERATEYATSVLLTNSFLLTTQGTNSEALTSSAFNSLSQLVASQLNRYINEALPNIDFSFGIQGESAQELDVTYGIALRLLDERLVIRGQGVYQGARSSTVSETTQQSLQGEFVVEVRLSTSVSVEVFYRREGDVLTEESFLTNTTGAGLSYQTEFASWRRFFRKIFGRDVPETASTGDVSARQQ